MVLFRLIFSNSKNSLSSLLSLISVPPVLTFPLNKLSHTQKYTPSDGKFYFATNHEVINVLRNLVWAPAQSRHVCRDPV